MNVLLMTFGACVMAATTVYAQYQVTRYTAGDRKVMLTRAVLIAVGCALGYLSAASFPDDSILALLAFVIGFGTVHVPAAFILFIKHERGAGKS